MNSLYWDIDHDAPSCHRTVYVNDAMRMNRQVWEKLREGYSVALFRRARLSVRIIARLLGINTPHHCTVAYRAPDGQVYERGTTEKELEWGVVLNPSGFGRLLGYFPVTPDVPVPSLSRGPGITTKHALLRAALNELPRTAKLRRAILWGLLARIPSTPPGTTCAGYVSRQYGHTPDCEMMNTNELINYLECANEYALPRA